MLRRYSIILHIVGWLIFLSLPVLFVISQSGGPNDTRHIGNPTYLLVLVIYVPVFYLHTYYLFPRLFLERKYMAYAFGLAALFAAVFFFRPYDRLTDSQVMPRENRIEQAPPPADRDNPRPPPPNGPGPGPGNERKRPFVDIISIALFILIIALSMALVVARRWRIATEQAARAEADKANAELSFLKAQINPHFLFNTLNNIYTLALMKDDQAADSIMMLSHIMRYVTDDATAAYVPLQLEVNCITDYIDLQRLRLTAATTVDLQLEGDFENRQIAPLILMTFVENLFKYGISNAVHSTVTIHLVAGAGRIDFMCQNRIFTVSPLTERTGIGIANTAKRLQQLYPGRHSLLITTDNGFYTVHLSLQD